MASVLDRGDFSVVSEEEFSREDDAVAFGEDEDADEGKMGEAVEMIVEVVRLVWVLGDLGDDESSTRNVTFDRRLVDELFEGEVEMIGDRGESWRRFRTDFRVVGFGVSGAFVLETSGAETLRLVSFPSSFAPRLPEASRFSFPRSDFSSFNRPAADSSSDLSLRLKDSKSRMSKSRV